METGTGPGTCAGTGAGPGAGPGAGTGAGAGTGTSHLKLHVLTLWENNNSASFHFN